MLRRFHKKYFELVFWAGALISLAVMQPNADPHYSFCIFKLIGIKFCPGCGLGHSISYLFHGDIAASIKTHPLGIFAVVIILYRIQQLIQLHFFIPTINKQSWK